MTALLTARSLSFVIGRARLIEDVSLNVERGDLLAVVGPNGAGKTTLLRLLAGEITPAGGTVRIDGRLLTDMSTRELAQRRAVLPQQTVTRFPFTARQIVGFARMPWLRTPASLADDEAVREAMRLAEVADLASRRFPTLSGGEQTRVSVARVLAQRTPLLLVDEPTSALDLRGQERVIEVLRDRADEGNAIVAVVHDLNLAAGHATRVALLHRGRLVACGAPAEILTASVLSEVFEHSIRVIEDPLTGRPIVLPERRRRGAAPMERAASARP
jgi:iron complex transport system ATP-binding protein